MPDLTRAPAFSLLANYEVEDALSTPRAWNIDTLFRAATYANKSTELGHISPTILWVASTVERIGARSRAAWKEQGWSYPYKPAFEKLTALWAAMDRRRKEVEKKDAALERKMAKTGVDAYHCAAENCGI